MSKFFQALERAQQSPPVDPAPPEVSGDATLVEYLEQNQQKQEQLIPEQPTPEQLVQGQTQQVPEVPLNGTAECDSAQLDSTQLDSTAQEHTQLEPLLPSPNDTGTGSREPGHALPTPPPQVTPDVTSWPELPPEKHGRRGQLDAHLVSLIDPTTFESEQYRALAHALERAHQESGCAVVAVSSPAVGDGKTTTTINLAGALSQTHERVLLVDADLRRPTVSRLLGIRRGSKRGLADIVHETALSLDDVIHPYMPFPLHLMPAGRASALPDNMLNSSRIEAIFEEARQQYDFIIVDTPPLIPFPDCRLIEQWVDGFAVVVTANKTPRKLVEEALATVTPEKLIGLVFNRDDRPVFGYYSYYSYAYGPHTRKSWPQRLTRRLKKWRGASRHRQSAQ